MKMKISLSIFVFLLIIGFVNGQSDFNIISDPKIELCPCSNQAYNILLQNTGSSAGSYKISNSGKAVDWIIVKPSQLTLAPGTATNLQVTVNSQCNIEGEFELSTFVTSSGLTKKITQNLDFIACYNYDVQLGKIQDIEEELRSISFVEQENGYEVCEGKQKVIPILIENKESYGNTYGVSFQGEDWSNINAKEFKLGAKEEGILLLSLSPPAGSEGNYNLKLDLITKLGELEKTTDIDVKVEKCFALILDIEKTNVALCGGDSEKYDVEVKNNGKFTEILNLEIEGADFISFEDGTELTLNSKSEETLSLNVNPSSTETGIFNVNVKASNDDISAEDTLILEITERNSCYKANIEFQKTINNQYTHEVFPVPIFNDGIRQTTFDLSVEGPSWISLLPNELELNPGEKGNVNLEINPEDDTEEGTFDLVIKVESNDEVNIKNVQINLKKENQIIKKIKSTIRFYKYYLYVLIVLVVLLIIFWNPISRQIKNIKDKHEKNKQKKELKRISREAREAKQEEEEKRKEDEKSRKEEEAIKKIEAYKKTEKTIKKKERKKLLSKSKPYLITLVILIAFGALIFLSAYFDFFDKNPYYTFLKIVYGAYVYLYYIIVGIILVFMLIYLYNKIKKKKKESIKNKPSKSLKKIKFFEKTYVRLAILILIALIILFSIYGKDLIDYVRNFVGLYLSYFITGAVVLIILILLIRFYKPVIDFLMEEDKKK